MITTSGKTSLRPNNKTLEMIGQDKPKPQVGAATIANKIASDELKIEWNQAAFDIRNKIRGLGPSTFSVFRDEKLKISKVDLSTEELEPGELRISNKRLLVGTLDSALDLVSVTPAGKREMNGFDFANGARIKLGEKFA